MDDRLSRRGVFARLAGLLGLLGAGAVVPSAKAEVASKESVGAKIIEGLQEFTEALERGDSISEYTTIMQGRTVTVLLPHGWVRVTCTKSEGQT